LCGNCEKRINERTWRRWPRGGAGDAAERAAAAGDLERVVASLQGKY
jgi:hypothetical protein